MACDYCGKVCKQLAELNGFCSTKNVKMVCPSCVQKFNKKKSFFMFKMAEKRMKKWVDRTRRQQNDNARIKAVPKM